MLDIKVNQNHGKPHSFTLKEMLAKPGIYRLLTPYKTEVLVVSLGSDTVFYQNYDEWNISVAKNITNPTWTEGRFTLTDDVVTLSNKRPL